jgi:hypothetical protein|tara:strand:- start:350 stop:613 length:264 start_codon:yes stop_codon:yes gene_type:complete
MRATDIIRSVLDLIDMAEKPEPKIEIQVATDEPDPEQDRFASVYKMLADRRPGEYGNSPNEVVADVEDITTAVRGEPQDGRVKDPIA